MKKIIKAILKSCMIVVLSAITIVPARANSTGTITIQLPDVSTEMNNVEFYLYKIGNVSDDLQQFSLVEELKETNVDLKAYFSMTTSEQKKVCDTLMNAVESAKLSGSIAASNEQGTVVFSQIEQGCYLVVQKSQANYGKVQSFLITVPYSDNGNELSYDVVTAPKAEPEKPKDPNTSTQTNKTLFIGLGILSILISFCIYRFKREELR